MSKILPAPRPKAPPQMYANFVAPIKVDYGYADDLSSIFATSTYAQITDKLNNNFNLNIRNLNGENLAFAIINNANEEITEAQRLDVIKRLEEKGTPICSINNNNQTIAHVAAKKGYFDIVGYVATKSCGIDLVDNYGNASIHYCVDKLVFDCGKDKVFEEDNKHRKELASESDISVIAKELIYKQMVKYLRDYDIKEPFEDIYKYVKLNKLFKIDDIEKIIEKRRKEYDDYKIGHRDTFKLDEATLKELTDLYENVKIKDFDISPDFVTNEIRKNEDERDKVVKKIHGEHAKLVTNLYDKMPKLRDGGEHGIEERCKRYYNTIDQYIWDAFYRKILPYTVKVVDAEPKHLLDTLLTLIKTAFNANNIDAVNKQIEYWTNRTQFVDELKAELAKAKNDIDVLIQNNDAKIVFEREYENAVNSFLVIDAVKNEFIRVKDAIVNDVDVNDVENINNFFDFVNGTLNQKKIFDVNQRRNIFNRFHNIINGYQQFKQVVSALPPDDKTQFIAYFSNINNNIISNLNDVNRLQEQIDDIEHKYNYPADTNYFNTYFVGNYINAIQKIINMSKNFNVIDNTDVNNIILNIKQFIVKLIEPKLQLSKLNAVKNRANYLHYQFEKYVLRIWLYVNYTELIEKCYYGATIANNIICIQQYLLQKSNDFKQALAISTNIYKYAIEAIVCLIKLRIVDNAIVKFDDVFDVIVNTMKYVKQYIEVCNKQMACEYFKNIVVVNKYPLYLNNISFDAYLTLGDKFDTLYTNNHDKYPTRVIDFEKLDFDVNDEQKYLMLNSKYLTYFYSKNYNNLFGDMNVFDVSEVFPIIDRITKIHTHPRTFYTGYVEQQEHDLEVRSENNKIYQEYFIPFNRGEHNQYSVIHTPTQYNEGNSPYPIVSMHYIGEIIKHIVASLLIGIQKNFTWEHFDKDDTKHYEKINEYMDMINNTPSVKETITKSILLFIVNQSIENMIDHECLYLIKQVRNEPTTNADYKNNIEKLQKVYRKRYFYSRFEQLIHNKSEGFTRTPFNAPPTKDSIHKITATQCTNDTTIEKFYNIKFNYSILDKNGNNVLNHLIAQYNVDGVRRIGNKIWEIKNVKNNQGLDSIGYLENMMKLLTNAWKPENVDTRLNSYADTLNNVVKNNPQFSNMESLENEPYVQTIIKSCFIFAFKSPAPIGGKIIVGYYNDVLKKLVNTEKMPELLTTATSITWCKNFVDYDKYEDSTYSEYNSNIINVMNIVVVGAIAVEFQASLINYFEDRNLSTYNEFAEILKQSIYIKLNIQNPNTQYPSIDILKEKLIANVYQQTGNPKNADDDKVMNTLMNYYIFLSDNIAFDFYAEANNFINDSIKLSTLTDIKKIIDDAQSDVGKIPPTHGKPTGLPPIPPSSKTGTFSMSFP